MTDESGINTQMTEAVTHGQITNIDEAPVQSFAILDVVMAETIGMGMHNAINAQHNMQMMASAAVTATCARMINGQVPDISAPQPADSGTTTRPPVSPIAPTDPSTIIANAQQETEQAMSTLSKAAQAAKKTISGAKDALNKLGSSNQNGNNPSPTPNNNPPTK